MAKRGRPKLSEDEQYPINKHFYKPSKAIIKKQEKNVFADRLYSSYLTVYQNAFDLKEFNKYDKKLVDRIIGNMVNLL